MKVVNEDCVCLVGEAAFEGPCAAGVAGRLGNEATDAEEAPLTGGIDDIATGGATASSRRIELLAGPTLKGGTAATAAGGMMLESWRMELMAADALQ